MPSSSSTARLMYLTPLTNERASCSLKSGKPLAPKRLQNRLTLGSLTPAAAASTAMLERVAASGSVRMAFATLISDLLSSGRAAFSRVSKLFVLMSL